MIRGTLIKTDGTITKVEADDGKEFQLGELQHYVGGNIQFITLPDERTLCLNEDGIHEGLRRNPEAQKVWDAAFPKDQYLDSEHLIVGDVVVIDK